MNLKQKLAENTDMLVKAAKSVSEANFNTKPDEESWSVADIIEHLYRTEFGIPKLFQGKTENDTDRDSAALVERFKKKLLNTEKKVKASALVLPKAGDKNREDWLQKFQLQRIKIQELIEHSDPGEICLMFEHPIFGYLNRAEWVYFSIYHTERHIKQMNDTIRKLA